MRLRSRLRLPKEHGAWAMLYVPFLLGAGAASAGGGRLVWLGLAVTFLFIGRESVLGWWRARTQGRRDEASWRWMWIYLGLAAGCGLPLLVASRLIGLVPLGVAAGGLLAWNAWQAARREERTIFTEMVGIAGLSLGAPAAYYVGRGHWAPTAGAVWLVSGLYFGGSVFYIRLRVLAAHGRRKEAFPRVRWLCGAYHGLLAALLAVAAVSGTVNGVLALAFAPAIARAFRQVARPAREVILRNLGVLELVYSAWFLVFAVLAFRSG